MFPSIRSNEGRDDLGVGVVHLGYGAFHRAHQSLYFDILSREFGLTDWGVYCINLRQEDQERFENDTRHLPYVLRSLCGDGSVTDRLIQVHQQAADWSKDPQTAEAALESKAVQMVTITVSEAGYFLDGEGHLDLTASVIREELRSGQNGENKRSIFAYLRAALTRRMRVDAGPITISCCDNIRGNGDMLSRTFDQYLEALEDQELEDWVAENVSFPNSMVDRITPRPPQLSPEAHALLEEKAGYALGPTIIAEDFVQWVIEDNFAGRKPDLASAGVTVTDNVDPYEEIKIRVLNGGHTALSYMGALAGFETYDAAFTSASLNEHFQNFEKNEVLPALPRNLPFSADEYLETIKRRFSNQHIGDTVERICGDGFAKFPIFIRPTLEGCFEQGKIPTHAIRSIASWIVFSRRVFSQAMAFEYFEPNRKRLVPLVQSDSLDDFVASETLWGDLGARFPQFKRELEREVARVEATWPA